MMAVVRRRVTIASLVGLVGCGRINFDPPPGPEWGFEIPLTVRGTIEQDDVPILVVLDGTRIDYSLAAPDGRDLRFVRAGAVLPHEIEQWNPSGQSLVWVRVPRLVPGETIALDFGNPDADDVQSRAQVWLGYGGVWHINQAPGTGQLLFDSTGNANGGDFRGDMPEAALVSGQIGSAIAFDGVDDFIEIPDSDSLDVTTFTIEGWVDYAAAGGYGTVISKDGVSSDTNGAYNVFLLNDSSIEYETNNQNVPLGDVRGCCITEGALHYFAFTMLADGTASVYVDGGFAATTPQVVPTKNGKHLLFGRRGIADSFLRARIDEVRISANVHSAPWFTVQYASMTDQLLDYGPAHPR